MQSETNSTARYFISITLVTTMLGWSGHLTSFSWIKTCYNGLFRQNKKGHFNVPYGSYKNPRICCTENISEVSKALRNTEIFCSDFSKSEKYIEKGSFVYFDPPYRPLNATAGFTDYAKEGFDDKDQERLAKFFKRMDKRGAYLMLSNSDPKMKYWG